MKFLQHFTVHIFVKKNKVNQAGLVPIYARLFLDGVRTECYLKKNIALEHWDIAKGKAKRTFHGSYVLNEYIDMVKGELNKHFNMMLASHEEVTVEMVKTSFQGEKVRKENEKSFLDVFRIFLHMQEEKAAAQLKKKGRHKRFKVLYGKVQAFIRHKFEKEDLLPSEMKLNFIVAFEHYLQTVGGISHNTAMKCAKDLKQVMNFVAIEVDLHHNPFQSFKCSYKKVKRKYLTQAELDAIENKEISISRLDEVRDCFVFCCYTGYSYQDVEALSPTDLGIGIDKKLWILRDRGKTGNVENVPLLSKALAILKKYKDHPYCKKFNKLLPVNSNVRYNAYLKEIADLCGITKLLTTHVARHTCATTILLSNGVPIETTMEFLGHNDIRTTRIYAKIVQQKLSEDMEDLQARLDNRLVNEAPH
ncbi:MAG: tyrosine-type recombinase/integrase [Chryseolinea sp.]